MGHFSLHLCNFYATSLPENIYITTKIHETTKLLKLQQNEMDSTV
jgi:hypothetical protein